MIEIIKYKDETYPAFQAKGFAAQFAIPYALHVCKGVGYDIGCGRPEWSFPGSIIIDPAIRPGYDALNLPEGEVDYIFSSHCLEHISHWIGALNLWTSKIRKGGTLFLYLPHPDQKYWASWVNTKHIHILHPEDVFGYFVDRGYTNIFSSKRDLNHSYIVMGQKI